MAQEGTPEKSSDASATDVSQIIFGAKNLEYQIDQFVSSGGQSVNILLSGKTGVGKSHLTNALIGENLALEGYDIDPQTDDVTPYEVVQNGVSITVYDTPGLADATGNDEEYLRKIKEKVTHFDLFLFCTEMTSKRFRTDDLETIKKLTAALGEKLWDHALVVLTFANEVPLSPTKKKDDGPEVNVFNDRFLAFKKAIKKHLVAIGVPEITVTNVPFTPAGELDDPRLPDREDWLTAFWVAAFKRINRNAKAAFLMANVDRIAFSSTFGEGNEEDKGKKDGNIVNLGPQFSGLSTEERNAIKVLRGKWQEFSFDKISSLCLEEGDCLTTTSQSSGLSTEERDAIKVLREKWQEFSFDKLSSLGLEKTEAFYETEEECPTPPGQSTGLSIEERNAIKEVRRRLQKLSFDKTLSLCLEKTETSDEPEEECPTPPGQVARASGPSIKVDETNSKDLINEVLGDVTGQLIGELTSAKFGRKYQTFFGWLMKYFKRFFPSSRPPLALKARPESMKK